jgi:hypothetical protein
MRGGKRCQGSTGRMKKHRYGNEFKMTAVQLSPGVRPARCRAVNVGMNANPMISFQSACGSWYLCSA